MILPLTTHGRGDVKVSEMGSNRAPNKEGREPHMLGVRCRSLSSLPLV
jgi:hypothetical protein